MQQNGKYQSTAQVAKYFEKCLLSNCNIILMRQQYPGMIQMNKNTWVPALVEFLQLV